MVAGGCFVVVIFNFFNFCCFVVVVFLGGLERGEGGVFLVYVFNKRMHHRKHKMSKFAICFSSSQQLSLLQTNWKTICHYLTIYRNKQPPASFHSLLETSSSAKPYLVPG